MNEFIAVAMFATPLILAALGDCIAQRAGLLNIGLEGQMLLGSFAGATVASTTGSPLVGLVFGTMAAAVFALASGLLSISLGADQIVVGVAFTLLATGATGSMYRVQYSQSTEGLVTPQLPRAAGIDVVMVLSLLFVALIWFGIFRTRAGLRLRAVGEKPEAAETVGANPAIYRYVALAIAGAFAGLAGGYLSIGVAGAFSESMTQGRGYVAIAMVTFGRWKPQWIVLSCLAIGWLESIQFIAQARGWHVPFQWLLAAPYVGALLILVVAGKGSTAPAALGIPYRGAR